MLIYHDISYSALTQYRILYVFCGPAPTIRLAWLPAPLSTSPRAKYYTPDITNMNIHRKMPLKIHSATETWNRVGKCH